MVIGLVVAGSSYYLKLDSEAIKLDSGSLQEAMAYVVASYSVFYQTYPDSLKIVFCFLENVMGMKTLNRLIKRDSLVVVDALTKMHRLISTDKV